jgi:membrane protease YdiL (CAAX protease family)
VATARATATVVAKGTEPVDRTTPFLRRRHLLFAALALLVLVVLSRAGWQRAELLGAAWPWDAVDMLLYRSVLLVPIACLAWLAFAVFDTRSGVTLIGPRWWKVGWEPWTVFMVMAAWYVAAPFYLAPEVTAEIVQTSLSAFHDEPMGRTAWGLLVASIVIGALTEELIFRGLLQRALAGYMPGNCAIVGQALVFEVVHLWVYELPFNGGSYFIWALAFGVAFDRTRSLAGPVALHSAGNLVYALAFSTAL